MTKEQMLKDFHRLFNCVTNTEPTIVDGDTRRLRKRLIKEEKFELFCAMDDEDIVKIADGLADLLYVVYGTALAYGIPIKRVFQEVHESNMTKLGQDGIVKRREDGKVLKPDTYKPVDLSWVLDLMQGRVAD